MAVSITPEKFLQDSGVDDRIQALKNKLQQENRKLYVSDVSDAKGNQYVDLVQEGGGVLGIALVGYTYVLEKMGIRFFSLAGTSAGSINAMLLACGGNKEDEKSYKVVEHLAKLNMFSFVDGKPGNNAFTRWIKKLVQKILAGGKAIKQFKKFVIISLASLIGFSLISFILNFFSPTIAKWFGLVAGILFLIIIGLSIFAFIRFKQFAKNGYGLNCGDTFHGWIKDRISGCFIENDPALGTIQTLADFSQHFMRLPELKVKHDPRRTNNNPPHMPMLTIITCDIIAERKIEFPLMWDLYWGRPEDVHPGDFVRASMSIPAFFESFTLKDIRTKSNFAAWDKHLNWQNEKKNIPDKSQLIDGGILSNFPINMFYNPNYPVPRMPTFGIRLQDGVLDSANRDNDTFFNYILSLFSTIRFNFDRDFITKNRAFNQAVCLIDVQEHSWLNFFMTDAEKIQLFQKGASAAIDFIDKFNWDSYKEERLANFKMSEEQFDNPNNLEVFPFTDLHSK